MKTLVFLAAVLCPFMPSYARTISGRVTDVTNKPVAGVSVLIKGTAQAVLCDTAGYYHIDLDDTHKDAVLLFTSHNYLAAELPVDGRQYVDARLEAQPTQTPLLPGLRVGNWQLNLGGSVNLFYMYNRFKKEGSCVTACQLSEPTDISDHTYSVQNGFTPAALSFKAFTKTKNDIEIKIVTTFYFGLVSNNATAYSDIDMRQIFFTAGKPRLGYFKFGRDFGFLGFEAANYDISDRGAGMSSGSRSPGMATAGGVGAGYIYGERYAQINYSTPELKGLQLTAGIFNPLDFTSRVPDLSDAGETNSPEPSMHAKLAYKKKWSKSTELGLCIAGLTQRNRTLHSDFRTIAGDIFARLKIANLELCATYHRGRGIGTIRAFVDVADTAGNPRNSGGGYVQAVYSFGRHKAGINYGINFLEATAADPATLIRNNRRLTFAYNGKVNDYITLVVEYSNLRSKNNLDGVVTNNTVNLGVSLNF